MKKQLILSMAILTGMASFGGASALATFSHSQPAVTTQNSQLMEPVGKKSFSLLNDTRNKVRLHTGSGFVTLNKGSRTSVGCRVGKKVSLAEKGKKKAVLFTIKSDMCGKKLELSDFM